MNGKNAGNGEEMLNVTLARRLSVDTSGATQETNETFIQIFWAAMEGLYNRVSGNALKVLLILAHHARVLGDTGRPGGEQEFQKLVAQGVVAPEDRGRLCAVVPETRLAELGGMGRTTVRRAAEELESNGYVRVVPIDDRQDGGRFGAARMYVFSAFNTTHIKKFDSAELEVEAEKPAEEPRSDDPPCIETAHGDDPPCIEMGHGDDPPCIETIHGDDPPCIKTAHGDDPPCIEIAHGEPHRVSKQYTNKTPLRYPTVPLRVPINGAGDARTHLPLLDELSLDFSWEEQAEYVEFWVQRFVEGRKTQAANTALAKAFGRAFGFQRDGELVVEPGQDEYARLGGLAKEFQDLGGHVAVWRAACRMWGRELAGDPLAYLAQSLIQERNERREEKHERRKPGRRGTGRQGAGADWPPGSGYRRLPDDAPRDYLADPFVEGDRDEPESG